MGFCPHCLEAYGFGSSGEPCEACHGLFKKAERMASELHPGEFRVATAIPKKLLAEEERFYDYGYVGPSLKARLNRFLVETLEARGGTYSPFGEEFFFDFFSGRVLRRKPRIFVVGYYRKTLRNIAHSSFTPSVAGEVKRAFEEFSGGKAIFMSSGREDVDARMLGRGRPFVVELRDWETRPDLFLLERRINSVSGLEVSLLAEVRGGFASLVPASHFWKSYRALVVCRDSLPDLHVLEGLAGVIHQRTPERVRRRRADLLRKRRVLKVSWKKLDERSFYLFVLTEPGLYVKELITGDSGRTHPSVSSLLGRECRCAALDVTDVKSEFLDFLISLGLREGRI